jgi:hypothetical protein
MWSPQRQDGDTKIVGPAYTVKYALLDDPAPKMAGHYVCDSMLPDCLDILLCLLLRVLHRKSGVRSAPIPANVF